MKKILLYFANKYWGRWEGIHYALCNKEVVTKEVYDSVSIPEDFICMLDKNYPEELKTIYKPPFCLFLYGNTDLLDNKLLIGVHGFSKKEKVQEQLKKFDCNTTFVVDYDNTELIDFLIKNNYKFIAINKVGINSITKKYEKYQKIIKNNNLIISEIPKKNTKLTFFDQYHNRLIIGLTKKMLFLDDNNSDKLDFNNLIKLSVRENANCYSLEDLSIKDIIQIKSVLKIWPRVLH